MKVEFDVRDVARKIEAMAAAGQEANVSGLRVVGELIMTDVKASRPGAGVPVDEGTLRASGRVEEPQAGTVELTFGGAAAPYALYQHEMLHLRHTVGEARYLVRGVERFQAGGIGQADRALQEMAEAVVQAGKKA